MYDILAFADTCVDLLMRGRDVVPEFGQVEKLVDNYELELGGSCCLFAAQAAKLGLKVAVLGKVGPDAFGELVIGKLKAAGVDTRFITVDPALKTGVTVHLTPSGVNDRAMLTYLGSLESLTPADITDDFLRLGRHLHYGSLYLHTGLLPVWGDIMHRAKRLGLSTSLDPNYDPSGQWQAGMIDALPSIDVFMPNDVELCSIARRDSLPDAVAALLATYNGVLAVKAGADGATVHRRDENFRFKPLPAAPGGDSTGAGDAFDAGFLAGWLNGLSLAYSLEIGCLCGRSVAGKAGGYAGQLWRSDLPALEQRTGRAI